MTRHAYLTIDDSPSSRTNDLVDALIERNVPAILFCRGDMLETNPGPIVRAIQRGFVVGNHGYTHKRASELGFEATCESIVRADRLIERAYQDAEVKRPGKYYRFAYMDRGMGPWFVEPSSVPPHAYDYVASMIDIGLGNDAGVLPSAAQIETKNALQAFLRQEGYTPVPFKKVIHDFYAQSEMANAIDAMFTFSTSDWAVTDRHKGKFGFETAGDLKAVIDADPHLARQDSAHIILAHDQNDIYDTTLTLVDYMLSQNFAFKAIA